MKLGPRADLTWSYPQTIRQEMVGPKTTSECHISKFPVHRGQRWDGPESRHQNNSSALLCSGTNQKNVILSLACLRGGNQIFCAYFSLAYMYPTTTQHLMSFSYSSFSLILFLSVFFYFWLNLTFIALTMTSPLFYNNATLIPLSFKWTRNPSIT